MVTSIPNSFIKRIKLICCSTCCRLCNKQVKTTLDKPNENGIHLLRKDEQVEDELDNNDEIDPTLDPSQQNWIRGINRIKNQVSNQKLTWVKIRAGKSE